MVAMKVAENYLQQVGGLPKRGIGCAACPPGIAGDPQPTVDAERPRGAGVQRGQG